MSSKTLIDHQLEHRIDRRSFLQTTGAAALVVGFYLPTTALAQSESDRQEKKPSNPFNAWVRITPDNQATLILGKSEMGQGVMTSLPMILAEELSLDWDQVKIKQAPTDPKIYDHGTGGSGSLADSWLPLRQAGAAAREMLISAAAQHWNVNRDTCKAAHGAIVHGTPKRYLHYGELVQAAAKLPVPDFNKVPLKNSGEFTIIGHDTHRVEAKSKTNGGAKFGIDSRIPAMLYAVIARSPVFGGRVASFDATKTNLVPGVRDVIEVKGSTTPPFTTAGVAVLADSTWAAIQGRKALKVHWEDGPAASESTESLRKQFLENAAKPGKVVRNDGDTVAALAVPAGKKIDAVYELPFAAHVCMEPMNCTVSVRPDGADAWVPTQAPQWARDVIAQVAGLPPESIAVHTTLMGGGFGRRYQADFVSEATQVSKAAKAPVMVVWTRDDDMQHDFYRPASYHRLQGALDSRGNLAAWKHFQTSTSIAAHWEKDGSEKPESSEFGTATTIPYATPNLRIEYALAHSSVPRAWWRSVEHSSSGFVVESFVDELAAAAKEDPLSFRIKLIGDARKISQFSAKEDPPLDTARLKNVLQVAASKAGWGQPLPKGQGRGLAVFYSFNTYVAGVAEVTVGDGAIKVNRFVAAVDCGRAVNPAGVRAQVESAVIYALTATLKDAITIEGGRVTQANFNDYEMLRMPEAPLIEVHVIDSTEAPTGIGEPTVPTVAPAVCNAIFAATGMRLRRLPLRSEDLA